MRNHFHLVIRTPAGNLSYGMKWLQATFANRYHRFRKVHGKLFQGRFKSLIVEEDGYMGALQHYVHLNPLRAGMCRVDELKGIAGPVTGIYGGQESVPLSWICLERLSTPVV